MAEKFFLCINYINGLEYTSPLFYFCVLQMGCDDCVSRITF